MAPETLEGLHGNLAASICVASDFNGPPAPYKCDGSAECRVDCPKICMHAEQRAILAVIGLLDDLSDLELVDPNAPRETKAPADLPVAELRASWWERFKAWFWRDA